MEDAIALAHRLNESDDRPIPKVLEQYESERKIEVLKIQSAARNSTEWFENVDRYAALPPEQFAYSLLTRSQRVSHEGLRQRDRVYLDHIESWFSQQAGRVGSAVVLPPMFTPFSLRDMHLANRVVVSPMAMYSAVEGVPSDFHLVHLGTRALGGAGLIFSEMTVVSPAGRITPGCAGIWNDEQCASWQRIVSFVHEHSQAKVCLQLGHAGPKGSTRLGWEGMDVPLETDNWGLLAASDIAWSADNQVPRSASRADMDQVVSEFSAAAKRGADAGFDMIELHAAHGYLLSSFISPLTNQRTDEYGGSLHNRIRFPLEVFREVRRVWPQARPMSVRLSVTDWHEDGLTDAEGVAVAQAFKNEGVDLVDVSTGQTSTHADPVYGRMYQVPFADRIRNEIGVATLAVGNIFEADHVNSILASGRADLVALARPHLSDPFWTLRAAAELNYDSQAWPPQYLAGRDQQHRNLDRTGQLLRQI
jgi:anthraniloyl-CoA monooxygenase